MLELNLFQLEIKFNLEMLEIFTELKLWVKMFLK